MQRRLRLGMVGGGEGAFIGAVHRIAARLDDCYELVAGALSSDPARARPARPALRLAPARSYGDYREMARRRPRAPTASTRWPSSRPITCTRRWPRAFLEAGIHVICDKPLAISLAEGQALAALAREKNAVRADPVYAGYPMVRHARAMVEAGEIGEIRLVQVEYPQDWLAEAMSPAAGQRATGTTIREPARAAPCATSAPMPITWRFVSGQQPQELLAELTTFVPGRALDDHVQVMLRYANGARGMLWASQMATGCEKRCACASTAARPARLRPGAPERTVVHAAGRQPPAAARGRVDSAAARRPRACRRATRKVIWKRLPSCTAMPRSHPRAAGGRGDARSGAAMPTVIDGVAGLAFIEAVLGSQRRGAQWTSLEG